MEIEEDAVSLINKIPRVENCCYCVNLKTGTKLIAILGILIDLLCAATVFIQGKKYNLTIIEAFLLIFLMLFIVITFVLIILYIRLLKAAVDENPVLMSYYIWLTIVYLSVQLLLAIAIPLLLVTDEKYHFGGAFIWLAIVIVVVIGWTHFISVVSTYRMSLL